MNVAALAGGRIGPDPKRVATIAGGACRHGAGEARRSAEIAGRCRNDLMQTAGGETASQHGIDVAHAKRQPAPVNTETEFCRFDLGHRAAQVAKG